MKHIELGRTGIKVSQLALGGHEYLPDGRSRGFNEDAARAVTPGQLFAGFGGPERKRLLHRAYDHGINLFDVTIDSEKEALGRNLKEDPPPYEVFIQTRPEGFCYSYDDGNRKFLDYGLLRAEVARCARMLRRDHIDLLNVGLLKWSIDRTPDYMDRLRANLDRLKAEGLIRHAVADSFSGQRLYLEQIASNAFDAVNLDLSIGEPNGALEVIPAARRNRLGVIAREVFFKGEIFRIGEELGVTDKTMLARIALGWAARQDCDVIIVGCNDAAQLDSNVNTVTSAAPVDGEWLDRIRATRCFNDYERKRTADFFERALAPTTP
jgi:aryl-alcohol dehydrogenase-like predicted oxidoreductase